MSVLSILLTTIDCSVYIMTAAGSGSPLPAPLVQTAVMLPREDIYDMYLDKCKVEDYNGDGIPEVYLAAASGWEYYVYFYLDGEMHSVEDLTPWAWSSDLCYTSDGHLALHTWSHTEGTAGYDQCRIYKWTKEGYRLSEDLWSVPDERDWDGTLLNCVYISKEEPFDPVSSEVEDGVYDEFLISKEEYEKRISNLGTMTSVFEDGLEWGWNFWQENDYEDSSVLEGVYRQIQGEILNWHD